MFMPDFALPRKRGPGFFNGGRLPQGGGAAGQQAAGGGRRAAGEMRSSPPSFFLHFVALPTYTDRPKERHNAEKRLFSFREAKLYFLTQS
jgi:hypothetical protein